MESARKLKNFDSQGLTQVIMRLFSTLEAPIYLEFIILRM